MSSIPQNKDQLVAAISTSFEKLMADYRSVPPELARTLGIEGSVKNTTISVCDTLAYLIGWGRLVLKWYALKTAGRPVDFPETGYKWNELGRLAQAFHHQYCDWAFADLLEEFEKTTAEILNLVASLDDEALYGGAWYDKWTLGRMIQFNTSSPMKNMRSKVRRFLKSTAAT